MSSGSNRQSEFRSSVSLVSPQQLLLTFVPPGSHIPTSAAVHEAVDHHHEANAPINSDHKKRRTRVVWGASETQILLDIWGPKYDQIRAGSIAVKRDLWREILVEFQSVCIKKNLTVMSLDQIRKRIGNLEYKYRQVKAKLSIADDKETQALRRDFPFYDTLDKVLGMLGSMAEHDTLSPADSPSCINQDDFKPDEGELSMVVNYNDTAVNKESRSELPEEESNQETSLKRKRAFDIDDEEPYLKQMCELWKVALERQEEWFSKMIEMHERVLTNQTTQMRLLVESLRDMVSELVS